MKAQFKYSFLTGLYMRAGVFAVIFVVNLIFITLGSFGLLPFAAHITAVSLGGVAIAVMFAFNVISDVAIARRMFYVPEAYLHALIPSPRWKILFASIITMMVMDIITMTVVITQLVWLSFNMIAGVGSVFWNVISSMSVSDVMYILCLILFLIAGYLLIITLVMFCITVKKSIFYKKPASGLLTFLLACGCIYTISLLQLLIAPLGSVIRYGILFVITFDGTVFPFYVLLILLEAAALFVLTSKLMERRMNV